MDFSPLRPESTFSVSFLRLHNAILKQMGEVRSQGVCDKSEQRAVLRKDVAGSREFLCFSFGAMNQRGLTLCSCQLLIQQAGEQQKTYSLLAVLPPPSSPHQYAPRSRSSHRTIFAPRLWAIFEICRRIRFILSAWGILL